MWVDLKNSSVVRIKIRKKKTYAFYARPPTPPNISITNNYVAMRSGDIGIDFEKMAREVKEQGKKHSALLSILSSPAGLGPYLCIFVLVSIS